MVTVEARHSGGTEYVEANPGAALDFVLKTVPGFEAMINDAQVLDYGCGRGYQALAMLRCGAKTVVGYDLPRPTLAARWERISQPGLRFTTHEPKPNSADVVLSCSSFEHLRNPGEELGKMLAACRPGGLLVITFAEPWYSPRGSHMDGFTKIPWLNLLFPESAVMRWRSRYKLDGAERYEDVEGGLNRMTVRKFENLMRGSGAQIQFFRLYSTKGLPLVTCLPVMRELLTSSAACVLRKW